MGNDARRYFAEAFAAFTLVFAGTGAIVANDVANGAVTHVGIALVFGLVVMAMIDTVGDVSGAHINPAVTIAFWAARRLPGRDVLPYIAAQFVGALLASGLLRLAFPAHETLGATLPRENDVVVGFTYEVVLTAILMYVILNVSTGAKEKGLRASTAIGGVIALEALFAGPICGASMNPARSLAPAVASLHFEHLWIYLTAPVLGALLAIPCCMLTRGAESETASAGE